jgi:hypothetical protein
MPPGIKASRNANLNQNAEMPKKFAKPPHTPAKMRLWRDRRKTLRSSGDMGNLLINH